MAIIPEPDLSFHHAWMKVSWAKKHIGELATVCNKIASEHPKTIALESDNNGRCRVVVHPARALPPEIVLWAGDTIHNLRAALDYCWMGLWRSAIPSIEKRTLPRGDNRNEVKGTVEKAAKEMAIKDVDLFVLDKLMPYREGGNVALWLAGKFDNWNKHNLLIASMGATFIREALISSDSGAIRDLLVQECRVISNVPMIPVGFNLAPGDKLKFDREPDITVEIIIGTRKPGEEGSVTPLLGAMLQETAKAVKLFHATFSQNPSSPLGRTLFP